MITFTLSFGALALIACSLVLLLMVTGCVAWMRDVCVDVDEIVWLLVLVYLPFWGLPTLLAWAVWATWFRSAA